MALGGVAQLVDHFQSGVHGCIIADGVLGAGDIVVDGAGQTDHRDAAVCQLAGTTVGTVAADDDQCINAQFAALGRALILTFLGLELQAAGRVKDRAAGLNDVGDTAQIHFKAFAVQQTIVAALNADHPIALVQTCTHHRTNCGIHAGGVAAAGQHTDRFDLLFHKRDSLQLFLHSPWSSVPFYQTPFLCFAHLA